MIDITEKIKRAALRDKKPGLLDGKLGASVYFFIVSGHDEESDAFKTASELLSQVLHGITTVRNIDLNNGLMGISLGIHFLMENDFLKDTSGRCQTVMDTYIYRMVVRAMEMELKGKEFASMVVQPQVGRASMPRLGGTHAATGTFHFLGASLT